MEAGLAIITFGALGHAYQVAQQVFTTHAHLKLIEILPGGDSATVILMGEIHSLREFGQGLRVNEGVTPVYVEKHVDALLKAFYALESKPVGAHLILFESETIGELFMMAEAAVGMGFEVLDFRAARGGQKRGLLSLTTEDGEAIRSLPKFDGPGRNLTVIRDRAPGFARFFPTVG
ncbi:MAG: hypothetical protein KF767_04450 [Bdellovibrionaceae bacterium]|nr:hypothetical protein [Pseudobdellovibrionaceae bacterium]